MSQPNEKLVKFHEELKALLDKYEIKLDVTSSIVAVDVSQLPKEQVDKVGLADASQA